MSAIEVQLEIFGEILGKPGKDAYTEGQLYCRIEYCVTLEGGLVLF